MNISAFDDQFFQPEFTFGPRPTERPASSGSLHRVVTQHLPAFFTAVVIATSPCESVSKTVIQVPMAIRERVTSSPVFAQIDQLEKLRHGWDSYGGAPPSVETIAAARRFALALGLAESTKPIPAPTVQAGGDGTVGFVWSDSFRKRLLDVEIHADQRLEYVLSGAGHYDEGTVETIDALLDLIAALG